jgi:hypothetical protein
MCASYRDATLLIELTDTNGSFTDAHFPILEARASVWETDATSEGSRLWIELVRRSPSG